MNKLKRHIPVALLIAALTAVVSVAAFAQGDDPPPSDSFAQVTTIEADAQDAMEILEEERTTTDAMSTELSEPLDEQADWGMNPDLSRRSIGTISASVYIVPGDDHVCAAVALTDSVSVICPETEDIANGVAGPGVLGVGDGAVGVYGLVPDGVQSVTVETGESDSDVVNVEGNAYFIAFPAETPLRAVSYTGPSGWVEYPISIPGEETSEE